MSKPNKFIRFYRFVLHLFVRFFHDGCAMRASGLAYTTLLSLVPLFIVSLSIMQLVPQFSGIGNKVETFILSNFVADSAKSVQYYIKFFSANMKYLSGFSIVILFLVSVFLLANMNRAFNMIWHIHEGRKYIIYVLIYFLLLVLAPLFLGFTLFITSYIVSMPIWKASGINQLLGHDILRILPYLVAVVTFTAFNWALPATRVLFRHALVGGVVSAVLFELAKYGFTAYIAHASNFRVVYGPFSIIPIFLVWLYFSWLMILFGALVTNVLQVGLPKDDDATYVEPHNMR